MKPRYFDLSRRSDRSVHLIENRRGCYRLYGAVGTPCGFVLVFGMPSAYISERDDKALGKWGPCTRLYLNLNGRQYVRSYPRILTVTSAVRAARNFAREVSA